MAQEAADLVTAEPQITAAPAAISPVTTPPVVAETAPAPTAEPASPSSITPEVASAEPVAGADSPVVIPQETPADPPPVAEVKPPEADAKQPRTYEDFANPEGFETEPAQISAYKNILTKFDLPQEAGQELLNFGADQVKRAISAESQRQQDVFSETQRKWSKQIDKEYGNRRDTVLRDANWVLSQYGGTKAQIKELNEALAYTGAGNHPAVVRALVNISKQLKEREAPPSGLPKNATQTAPAWEKRYGARA